MMELSELTLKVRELAVATGAFIREEREKFSRERIEKKHAHDYVWNEDGTRKDRIDRDLNEFEIKAHSDLLKGGGNHG